jgi:hypothetical protein
MNAAAIARALGGKRSGNQWKCKCPAHADKDPSMIIFDGREAVQVRCYAGCDPLDIIGALRSMGLWEGSEDGDGEAEQRRRQSTPATDPSRHHRLAMQIWEHAVDPRGTPAEDYLRGRGLALPSSACVTAIRYHEQCPMGDHVQPALVALMRNVETFAAQAIQRLFLDLDQNKKIESMMLGPVGGAAMMISQRGETFSECLSYCSRLFVCEGLETGLALHQTGRRPVWALGSAGTIARLPVLFAVGHLVICTDNDNTNTGISAAIDCAERWNATPKQKATIVMPDQTGTDYADQVKGV